MTDEDPEDIIHRLLRLGGAANERQEYAAACGYVHAAILVGRQLKLKSPEAFATLRDKLARQVAGDPEGAHAEVVRMMPSGFAEALMLATNRPPEAP